MKRSLCRALVSGALSVFAAASMSAAFSGAIYTSTSDGATVNANNFDDCSTVYLNGGPQGMSPAGLPDGEYYFQVTDPSGATLLSDTLAWERRVKVVDGVISGRAVGLPTTGTVPDGFHMEGSFNPENGSTPVQLWHFDETPNTGGVYKVWLIPVDDATVEADGITLTFDSSDSKTDNFRCVHEDGGPGSNTVVIFGRKYYDANANGVFDGGEEWNEADGRPTVTIEINFENSQGVVFDTTTTDENGLWFYEFDVTEGETITFEACEVVPDGYNQTGPLDGDSVTNGEASATASGFCWDGTITSSLGLTDLNFGNVDTVTIGGMKFYDANVNGVNDGEEGIEGFKIVLEITYPDDSVDTVEVWTDATGAWTYDLPVGSSVTACEVMPLGSWVQTAPAEGCYALEDLADDASDLDFGNVCLGPGGGHTLGYWSNKNGQKTANALNPTAFGAGGTLSLLHLRNADGSDFDPASSSALSSWLLSSNAVNMANMLSAQLAAMHLNVRAAFVDGDAIVYGGDCLGAGLDAFISINDLMADADASLAMWADTTSPHAERSSQECLKDALDDANNNLNFVQAEPCPVEYPIEE